MKQTGEIDSKTANAIIELYIKYFQSGDFNNDGKINMKDVTDIQKKIAHK